jgi:dihydrofolate synthase/folylpolyglutamate synthase
LNVLRNVAKERNAQFVYVDEPARVLRADLYGSRFEYGGATIELHLGGRHQIENAQLAMLISRSLGIGRAAIEEGLSRVKAAGRSEIMKGDQLVLLDGAHNPDKISALVKYCVDQRLTSFNVVFGVLAEKDVENMLVFLKPITRKLFATRSSYAHRQILEPRKIVAIARKCGIPAEAFEDSDEAFSTAAKEKVPVLITGSLFLAGELRQKWYPPKEILERRRSVW